MINVRKKFSAVLVIAAFTILTLLSGSQQSFATELSGEDIIKNSKAGILYEATTGTVVCEKNADMQLPPASMTKVMTAILVLEKNPTLEGELTVNKNAVRHYYCSYMEPQRHLLAGEVISYEECMKYLLIPSGNEAATAFAFELCDTFSEFIDMMNAKAKELGCENTNFKDPVGLSSSDHYTTPRDMVKICEYAMQFDKFREIVAMEDGAVPASNVREKGFDYYTTNYVKYPDDRYESPYSQYVTGIKTGYTPAAGWCLSSCMEKDGLVWYTVVMGGDELDNGDGRILQGDFIDTIALYEQTEGLTADDLKKPVSPLLIGGIAIAAIAVIVLVFFAMKKKKTS